LQVIKRGKNVLPTVARLCLIATFFEDGLRMYIQWNEQREYMDMSWGCGKFLATVFVLVNLLGQLGGCGMVMARFKVDIAVGLLFFIVVLQVSLHLYQPEAKALTLTRSSVCRPLPTPFCGTSSSYCETLHSSEPYCSSWRKPG